MILQNRDVLILDEFNFIRIIVLLEFDCVAKFSSSLFVLLDFSSTRGYSSSSPLISESTRSSDEPKQFNKNNN